MSEPQNTPSQGLRRWLREPLLHFVLIGAAVFALDAWVSGGIGDPKLITIDAAVDRQAVDVFRQARGREPNDDELYALRRIWLDNEVLYREGLALQMDLGDDAIRDRVIFKALSMINAGLKLPPYDDASLRQWFEKNRAKYDEPPRYDFQEAVLTGETGEAAVRAFVDALNAGAGGDAQAGLRVFKGRPHGSIVESYGADFAAALESAPVGRWVAIAHRGAWRAMRLESVTPAKPAVYEELRGVVLQDWTDATLADQRTAAVRTLAKKYKVVLEEPAP
jgi:hypothetical protein